MANATNKKTGAKKATPKKAAPAQVKDAKEAKDTPKALTPEEKAAKVKDLVDKLAKATTSSQKKAIRRSLRALGHQGGLGKKVNAKKEATK